MGFLPPLKDWERDFINREMLTEGKNLDQLLESMGMPGFMAGSIAGPHQGGGQGGGQGQDYIGGQPPPATGGPGPGTGMGPYIPPTSVPPSGWTENYGDPRRSDVDLYLGPHSADPRGWSGYRPGGSPIGEVYVGPGTDPRTSPSASPSTTTVPTVPTVPDFKTSATSPWRGTVQFGQGNIVYKIPEGFRSDPAWMQANQDWLIEHGYAMTPETFGQHMGIDIYEPGYVPGSYTPQTGLYGEFDPRTYANPYAPGGYASPQQIAHRADVKFKQEKILEERERAKYRQWAASQGYNPNIDYSGYGYSGPAYPQSGGTFASGVPAAPVGYPDIPAVPAGEPSFSPDPILDDASLDINTSGLEALSIPARTRLTQWLRDDLGFRPQGVLSSAGETSWQRPEGESGNIAFSAEDYAKITDPTLRSWIKWLMGKMGYSGASAYPLAAA